MTSPEEYFGKNAGIVWSFLKGNPNSSIAQIKRKTKLTDAELYGALGWLGREEKLIISGEVPLLFKFAVRD